MIRWDLVNAADGIIFDCDGTLVDSMPVHYLAWHETMSRYGIVFDEDRFYSMGGMPTQSIIEILSREQNVTIDSHAAAHEKELAFLDRITLLEPIEPVMDVVRGIRGKKPIAVASGGYRSVILRQLQQIDCVDCFDAIVTAEDTQLHKPEPDVFLEAARRLQIDAPKCLVFEDADLGVEAARRAGMPCIDVRDFYQPRRITVAQH